MAVGVSLAAFTATPVQAYTLTSQHSFSSAPAEAPLVKGDDGNYYGFAEGNFYQLTSDGTYTVVEYLGVYPTSLIKGSDGNFYGTDPFGGFRNYGMVFQVTPSGTLSVLAEFDGEYVSSPGHLIQGSDGNFYGTTEGGYYTNYGTVFELDSSTWTTTTLASLDSWSGWSATSLIQASDGYLYGTAEQGGYYDGGTLFRLDPAYPYLEVLTHLGGGYTYEPYGIPAEGAKPAYLIEAENGKFIGMTNEGGWFGRGVMFTYTEAMGYQFQFDLGGDDYENWDAPATGHHPNGAPTLGGDGYFYGTMKTGGAYGVDGGGTLYRLSFNFNLGYGSYTEIVQFDGTNSVGDLPRTGLTSNGSGSFYGTTSSSWGGGGKLFKFTP